MTVAEKTLDFPNNSLTGTIIGSVTNLKNTPIGLSWVNGNQEIRTLKSILYLRNAKNKARDASILKDLKIKNKSSKEFYFTQGNDSSSLMSGVFKSPIISTFRGTTINIPLDIFCILPSRA